ncbi:MAG: phosphodiesterase [Leptolyngbya sp. SIO4C5]|nr:phosphodiesterase [Leptolyngbya sp. SIO4C5]
MTAFTLIQITDTHLLADPTAQLRGCTPWQTLQDCLRQVAVHQPDGLLITGDLADQGQPAAYDALITAVSTVSCPVYWLPGNHDDVTQLQAQLQTQLQTQCQLPQWYGLQAVDLGVWRLLLLNSVLLQAKWGEGYLAADQLHWLRRELTNCPDRPTLVALHHHPVATGIDWLDQMPLQNAAELLAILADFAQVRVVLFGHIHQALAQQRSLIPGAAPISFYGCPSTCLQVSPPQPASNAKLPGFRLLYLEADGRHQTQVQRVRSQAVTHA